jgi:PAS domain S-box-containing protein
VSDVLLAALTERAPDIVALVDRDRILKYVSPAVLRILGYEPSELIGKRFDEILHPEDFASADQAFATMVGTQDVVTAQDRFRRKDGSWITLESVARNYLDAPELGGILICSRDITRHVELESTLRRSADEAAELFDSAPCGYHSVDAAGVFCRINGTELRWLQRTRDELVGRMRFVDLLTPASAPDYGRSFEALKNARAGLDLEVEVVRKDGSTFAALLRSAPVRDARGRFLEGRTTLYDITERKSAERALRKANRALRVLSETRRQIIRAHTEPGLLDAICRALIEQDGYRVAAVHQVEHDTESTMKLVASAGAAANYLESAATTWGETDLGQGPIGRAVRTGRPQVNRSFLADPKMTPWRELALQAGVESSMSVPLKDASGVFATLSVLAAEPDAFDTEEMCLLEELAADLSFGIGSLRAKGTMEEPPTIPNLSPRERDVLKLVAEGHSSKEIAAMLGVAPASIGTYRSRLMFKLDVEDVTGLVRFAIRHGIIRA